MARDYELFKGFIGIGGSELDHVKFGTEWVTERYEKGTLLLRRRSIGSGPVYAVAHVTYRWHFGDDAYYGIGFASYANNTAQKEDAWRTWSPYNREYNSTMEAAIQKSGISKIHVQEWGTTDTVMVTVIGLGWFIGACRFLNYLLECL